MAAQRSHAFIPAVPPSTSSWTGLRLSTTRRPITSALAPSPPNPLPKMTVSPSLPAFRRARLQSTPVLPPSKPALSPLTAALVKPARAALALTARTARSVSSLRRRHASTLYLARMGVTLALAAVSFFVTRGTLSGLATVPTAPVLPAFPRLPFTITLPNRLAAILKPFTEAFGVVFLSEFGDKSMFATALMAMKHRPFIVCIGALAALTVMTFIACFLGQLMHLLPATVTHYSSIALFVFFGLQMIMQSRSLPDTPGGAGGERADAEEMVAEASVAKVQSPMAVLAKVASLIFVAEWCDRSMLATMALAASSNTVAVIGGATAANVLCTGVAVCAATLVSSRISERMVALVAGILFEVFAVFTYFEGPEG